MEEAIEQDAIDKELYENTFNQMRDFKKLIKFVYGENSKEYKYVSKLVVPYPRCYVASLERAERYKAEQVRKAEEARLAKEREALAMANHTNLVVKATKFLLERGVEITDPIKQANEIAEEELRAKLVGEELSCGCNECESWIVGDHRCTCGNRRVYLNIEGDFDNLSYYAECY